MIDLKKLKDNKNDYLISFKNKGFDLQDEVSDVIKKYEKYLALLEEEQLVRKDLNIFSKELKKTNEKTLIEKAKKLSLKAKELKNEINEIYSTINEIASYFPNPASNEVPVGKNENENIVISTHLDELKKNDNAKPHWELINEKKLVLQDEAANISGTRQVIYNDKAALVVKALEKFMIDNAIKDERILIEPPVIVNKEALYNTSQLPKFEEDLFKVGNDQYLIPTAEVPLTNLVANKLLKEDDLPLKYVGATSCFRKEAGSAGKDTRGLIRLHQFRKVELVSIGKQEDEEKDFGEMLRTATNVLEKLKLPYRLLQLCTGDASFASKKTIDIEVWMPGVNRYREISSVSAIGDFQARRMKARYKDSNGKKSLVYTYNGSSLAIGRTMAAIIENNVQENGDILVPDALKEYLPFDKF